MVHWRTDKNKPKTLMLKKLLIIGAVLVIGIALFINFSILSMPRNHGHVEVQLFVGATEDQSLIVAFGGSEGGSRFVRPCFT